MINRETGKFLDTYIHSYLRGRHPNVIGNRRHKDMSCGRVSSTVEW